LKVALLWLGLYLSSGADPLSSQPIMKAANLEQVVRAQGKSWEGSSQIWLLDLKDGTRAVFRSEDEPWGSQAEVAGYRFSHWLGLQLVPPTFPRVIQKKEWPGKWPFAANSRQGSLQLYLPIGKPAPVNPDTRADIEVVSYIMGRYDNHAGNLIFDQQGQPHMVDFENTLEIQKTKYGQISYVRRGQKRPDLPSSGGDFPYDQPAQLVEPSLTQIRAQFSPWWVYWPQGMESLHRQTQHLPDRTVNYAVWDHRLWVQARAVSRHPAYTEHYHQTTMERLQQLNAQQLATLLPAPYGPEHVASMLERSRAVLQAWHKDRGMVPRSQNGCNTPPSVPCAKPPAG